MVQLGVMRMQGFTVLSWGSLDWRTRGRKCFECSVLINGKRCISSSISERSSTSEIFDRVPAPRLWQSPSPRRRLFVVQGAAGISNVGQLNEEPLRVGGMCSWLGLGQLQEGQVKCLRRIYAIVPLLLLSLRPEFAWASVAEGAVNPAGKGLLASAWTGLVAGCLHTLTGPDHLAALAPLCIGRTRLQSAAVGALWGCGHDAGQILFGLAFLLVKDRLHMDFIRTWSTRVVGLTLVIIGGMGIYESQEAAVPALVEDCSTDEIGNSQGLRRVKGSLKTTTFATGVVYGLQPDALLMILPALALPSRITGAAYLGMFLLGTVLAMGSYTLFLSSASLALQKKLPGITKRLTLGSALIAIGLGLGIFVGDFVGISLF